jgi:hypothetical protein
MTEGADSGSRARSTAISDGRAWDSRFSTMAWMASSFSRSSSESRAWVRRATGSATGRTIAELVGELATKDGSSDGWRALSRGRPSPAAMPSGGGADGISALASVSVLLERLPASTTPVRAHVAKNARASERNGCLR